MTKKQLEQKHSRNHLFADGRETQHIDSGVRTRMDTIGLIIIGPPLLVIPYWSFITSEALLAEFTDYVD